MLYVHLWDVTFATLCATLICLSWVIGPCKNMVSPNRLTWKFIKHSEKSVGAIQVADIRQEPPLSPIRWVPCETICCLAKGANQVRHGYERSCGWDIGLTIEHSQFLACFLLVYAYQSMTWPLFQRVLRIQHLKHAMHDMRDCRPWSPRHLWRSVPARRIGFVCLTPMIQITKTRLRSCEVERKNERSNLPGQKGFGSVTTQLCNNQQEWSESEMSRDMWPSFPGMLELGTLQRLYNLQRIHKEVRPTSQIYLATQPMVSGKAGITRVVFQLEVLVI